MNEHFILRMTVNPKLLRLRHQRGTFLRLQDASCAFLCSVNVPLCLQNALNVNARSQLGNLRTVGQRSRDCVLLRNVVARTNYCTWMPEGHPGGGHRREKLPTGTISNIWPPQFRSSPLVSRVKIGCFFDRFPVEKCHSILKTPGTEN